eukprot:GFUD01050702.1.p1 GENE.GFUD01050702.1~~GFUD01050702.1.p1  ORF type:complete len:271 (+),score=-17.47 GFUD01050702.1:43-855(+)
MLNLILNFRSCRTNSEYCLSFCFTWFNVCTSLSFSFVLHIWLDPVSSWAFDALVVLFLLNLKQLTNLAPFGSFSMTSSWGSFSTFVSITQIWSFCSGFSLLLSSQSLSDGSFFFSVCSFSNAITTLFLCFLLKSKFLNLTPFTSFGLQIWLSPVSSGAFYALVVLLLLNLKTFTNLFPFDLSLNISNWDSFSTFVSITQMWSSSSCIVFSFSPLSFVSITQIWSSSFCIVFSFSSLSFVSITQIWSSSFYFVSPFLLYGHFIPSYRNSSN